VQGGDHQPGHEVAQRVEVQRHVDRAGVQRAEQRADVLRPRGQQREDPRGRQRRPVGRGQRELVGRLEPLARHQVGHGGVLGGQPDQADRLDQHGHDEDPRQGLPAPVVAEHRGHDRDRGEQDEPQQVADDQVPAPVQPVGDVPGERPDHDGGQHPQEEHPGDREVLLGVTVTGELAGERGQREQPQPVTQAGKAEADPESAERAQAQHPGQRVGRRAEVVRDGPLGHDLSVVTHALAPARA
jgi:hypothetical protein